MEDVDDEGADGDDEDEEEGDDNNGVIKSTNTSNSNSSSAGTKVAAPNTDHQQNQKQHPNPLMQPSNIFLDSTIHLLLSPQPLLGLNQALTRVIG